MSYTIRESTIPRDASDGDRPSNRITYLAMADVGQVGSEESARDAVRAYTPATFDGLKLRSVNIDDRFDEDTYVVSAQYESAENQPKDVGENTVRFSTRGATEHVSQSLATISRTKAGGGTAPSMNGAIGVTADGVEGVDIVVPTFNFEETWVFAPAAITPTYLAKLFELSGSVNDAVFRNFEIGTCRFDGVEASRRADGNWELAFAFSCSRNRTDIPIGPDITVPSKKGWQYLWVKYRADTVGTGGDADLARKPIGAYVEQVYPDGDFSELGIGV